MIPLSIPHLDGNEWKYVKECLDTGWVSSAGKFVTQFGDMTAEFAGSKNGVACVNGTAGLHLGLKMLGVQTNDYVIVPNITFIASVNAIKYTNANPILIDVDAATWQMDLDLLEQFLEEKTTIQNKQCILKADGNCIKAIMPVHVLGNMCDMERLMVICNKYNIAVIEDASESLGSTYNGKHSGTFGKIGVFSFNGNKIITTGGGGVIVSDDDAIAQQAKHLSTQAKTSPDEYVHDAVGHNYRLVNVLAAIGVAQMEQLPEFIKRKKHIDQFYRTQLAGIGDIQFQKVEHKVDPNCWLCTIKTSKMRMLIKYLNDNGVMCRPFWMPMNQLEMFAKDIYVSNQNQSDKIYQSCLSIPSSVNLTDEQLHQVVNTIKQFFQDKVEVGKGQRTTSAI